MKRTTARELFDKCAAAGADPKGTYTAHCKFTHPWLYRLREVKTGKIKGLYRACWNAKVMAVAADVFTYGDETGIEFWVEGVQPK